MIHPGFKFVNTLGGTLMKRKTLSQKDLDRIAELRQRGTSWLGIEKETGIPRYVAKREYQLWEKSSTLQELRGVRLRLAEDEFKRAGQVCRE